MALRGRGSRRAGTPEAAPQERRPPIISESRVWGSRHAGAQPTYSPLLRATVVNEKTTQLSNAYRLSNLPRFAEEFRENRSGTPAKGVSDQIPDR